MRDETQKLINAAKAALQFYDTLEREDADGEERVLDRLGQAVFHAERALSPTPSKEPQGEAA